MELSGNGKRECNSNLTKSYDSTRKHKQTSVKLKLKACDNKGMARARACLDN